VAGRYNIVLYGAESGFFTPFPYPSAKGLGVVSYDYHTRAYYTYIGSPRSYYFGFGDRIEVETLRHTRIYIYACSYTQIRWCVCRRYSPRRYTGLWGIARRKDDRNPGSFFARGHRARTFLFIQGGRVYNDNNNVSGV